MTIHRLLSIGLCLAGLAQAQAARELRGRLVRGDVQPPVPVAQAGVSLLETGSHDVTDDNGVFHLFLRDDLGAGHEVTITVSAPGLVIAYPQGGKLRVPDDLATVQEIKVRRADQPQPVPDARSFGAIVTLSSPTIHSGEPEQMTAVIRNISARVQTGIRVHIEAYDGNSATAAKQKVVPNQSFGPSESKTYSVEWSFARPGLMIIKIGLFRPPPENVAAFFWLDRAAKIDVEPAGPCQITISSPGANVGTKGELTGSALVPAGDYLWVFVHNTHDDVFWPQGGGPRNVNPSGTWRCDVTYGEPGKNIGDEFEVMALAVDATQNAGLQDWIRKKQDKGIARPPAITSCPSPTVPPKYSD